MKSKKEYNKKESDKQQKYYCPICHEELEIDSGLQVDGIHKDDLIGIGLGGKIRHDETEIECPNPDCKMFLFKLDSSFRKYLKEGKVDPQLKKIFRENKQKLNNAEISKKGKNWEISYANCKGKNKKYIIEDDKNAIKVFHQTNLHAFRYNGHKSMMYKHWLEKYIELPQRLFKRRGALFGLPAKWKICIPIMALSLALFLNVVVYNLFYLATDKIFLVDSTFGFFDAIVSFGFILFFYYILRDIKISIGSLEESFEREYGKGFVYKTLKLFYANSHMVTLIALFFVYAISSIDNVTNESLIADLATIGNKTIYSVGLTIGICYLLLLMALHETQLKGNYFSLKNRVDAFSNISLKIVLVIALLGAVWKIGAQYTLSTEFKTAHPLYLSFVVYTIALPVASVLMPFIFYSILIYKLNKPLKEKELEKIKASESEIIENVLVKPVDRARRERLNTLFLIEDRIKKSSEWIFEPRVFFNLILAVLISVSPNILSKFL